MQGTVADTDEAKNSLGFSFGFVLINSESEKNKDLLKNFNKCNIL